MEILTTVTTSYMQTFAGYMNQFIAWGQIIFSALLGINFIWLCLWYAFDKESIPQALSAFLKKAFVIMLFYTFMLHPNWLMSVLKTSTFMGNKLTGIPMDPSSIISNGIAIANKIIFPVMRSSLLTLGMGALITFVAYCIILFCFMVVALDLAVTLITSSALVAVSPLFLAFAALNATTNIARQTLDVILGNAVKLLGLYLTVAAGAKTMEVISTSIPTELISFDPYCWVVACALLFWQVSKHLPNQLARIVSGAVHDHHGSEMAGMAMTATRVAPTATRTIKMAASGVGGVVGVAASIAHNAAVRMMTSSSGNMGNSVLKNGGGVASDVVKSGSGTLSDHFKNMMNKTVGGPGTSSNQHGKEKSIAGFSERMYQATQDFKAKSNQSSTDKPISKPPTSTP